MPRALHIAALGVAAAFVPPHAADDLAPLNNQWAHTITSLYYGEMAAAQQGFDTFNIQVRTYVKDHGLNWQIEYLIGSLDCLFPSSRNTGSQYLQEILQNSRGLTPQATAMIRRVYVACLTTTPSPLLTTSKSAGISSMGNLMPRMVAAFSPTPPPDLTTASAHAHAQGASISGDMKSGSMQLSSEPPVPTIPIPATQLLARRTPLDQPGQALARILPLLPAGATGSVTGPFAVVAATPTDTDGIGRCLSLYAAPLQAEFQIAPPSSMVTVYAVTGTQQLTQQAATLHGLQLPLGTVAYSVPEDNSLTAYATPTACGSMAHELLHLLIKRSFPGAPAWLEEGLASEIAVAIPAPTTFRMGWSWRDEALVQTAVAQPTLAELLETPWDGFTTTDRGDLLRVQATQSLAAVFIRYLDARGQLVAVYQAVRDRHLPADLAPPVPYAVLIAQATGDSLPALQEDFNRWFQQQSASHRVHSGAGNDVPHGNCTPPSSPMAQQMPCPPPPAAGNDPATPGHP